MCHGACVEKPKLASTCALNFAMAEEAFIAGIFLGTGMCVWNVLIYDRICFNFTSANSLCACRMSDSSAYQLVIVACCMLVFNIQQRRMSLSRFLSTALFLLGLFDLTAASGCDASCTHSGNALTKFSYYLEFCFHMTWANRIWATHQTPCAQDSHWDTHRACANLIFASLSVALTATTATTTTTTVQGMHIQKTSGGTWEPFMPMLCIIQSAPQSLSYQISLICSVQAGF